MSTKQQQKRTKLAILYGGKSGEHEVSLITAVAVVGALDFEKYELFPFYITKRGQMIAGERILTATVDVDRLRLRETTEPGNQLASAMSELLACDVAFPLLHGTNGEDGTVQGLLEILDIPYVGTGVLASAVGMDKVMMKRVFAEAGLPQCRFVSATKSMWDRAPGTYVEKIEQQLGYPCFVKPANSGSSVGISKAKQRTELLRAIELAFRFDQKIVIEEAVDAREVEVAVLGNEEPMASVVGEIISSNEFYDYRAKYVDGKSQMMIPAELSEGIAAQLRTLAIAAFQAIDGSGLSRVDFFLDRQTGSIYLNEINTMPGFTPFSMYPLLWKETGKSYRELLDDLIMLAVERHGARSSLQYSIEDEMAKG